MTRHIRTTILINLLATSFFITPLCHADGTNPHDGLTWWNRIARVVHGYFIQPLSDELAPFKQYWQHSCGFSDNERTEWLSKFRFTAYDTPRGYFGPELSDIKGFENVKNQITDLLAYVKNPKLYAQTHDSVITNYCFLGPRSTGKSRFIHALMHEIHTTNNAFRVFELPGEELLSILLQENSREGFMKRFQAHGPCVIFIKNFSHFTDYFFGRLIVNDASNIPGIKYSTIKELSDTFGNLSSSPESPVILLFTAHKLETIDTSFAIDWHTTHILFT